MDLESYIGRYSGETRLRRLISIAQGRRSEYDLIQRQSALDLAEQQMIKDGNVQLYRQVFAGRGGRIFNMDLFESKFYYLFIF
jgi:hypothetical protein